MLLIKGKCLETARTTLCHPASLYDIGEDPCVPFLARSRHEECIFKLNKQPSIKLQREGDLLIKNIAPTQLENSCGMSNHTIAGSFLISFKNCSVWIGNRNFQNIAYKTRGNFEILPMFNISIKQKNQQPLIALHDLHQLHVNNREKLDEIHLLRHWKSQPLSTS